jgi:hypothetical protein
MGDKIYSARFLPGTGIVYAIQKSCRGDSVRGTDGQGTLAEIQPHVDLVHALSPHVCHRPLGWQPSVGFLAKYLAFLQPLILGDLRDFPKPATCISTPTRVDADQCSVSADNCGFNQCDECQKKAMTGLRFDTVQTSKTHFPKESY